MDALFAASPTADDDERPQHHCEDYEEDLSSPLDRARRGGGGGRAPAKNTITASAQPPRADSPLVVESRDRLGAPPATTMPMAPPPRADSPPLLGEGRDLLGALPPPRQSKRDNNDDDADAQAAAAALRQSQELLLGPRRPRPHKAWRRRYVKLLVVGDSGTGKTTLVRTLLSTPGEQLQVHDGSSTPAAQFARDPESLCTTVAWRDEEDRVVWVFRVQDTPGYSDLELPDEGADGGRRAHAAMIRRYVHAQNEAWLAREQSPDRALLPGGAEVGGGGSAGGAGGSAGGAAAGALDGGGDEEDGADDPRVDLVLYALPPHRLRASDLRYMAELGKVAPLLPVVCKCDTMTIGEARRFRREVHDRLVRGFGAAAPSAGVSGKGRRESSSGSAAATNNPGYAINVFQFDRDTLARAGLSAAAAAAAGRGAAGADDDASAEASSSQRKLPIPPFLVVASNDVNDEMGALEAPVFWPERRYAWGTAEAFNPQHSDLLFLRALLLKEGLEAIVRDKRRRYERWRREQLTRPHYGRALRSFLVWTAAPVAAVLWWARDPEGVARAGRAAGRVGGAVGRAVARAAGSGAAAVAEGVRRRRRGGKDKEQQPVAAAPPPAPARRFGGGRAAALAGSAPAPVAVEPADAARNNKRSGPFGLW
jgi:septin 7